MTLSGYDVSYYQSTTPTDKDFVIARACYGTAQDSRFTMHRDNTRAAGKRFGAYAFGVYGDGAAQARAFLAIATGAEFLALDLEQEYRNGVAIPRMTDTQAKAFIATVKAAGHKCYLYHSLSGFPSLGQSGNWVAYWSTNPPSIPYTMWQNGSLHGIDHDYAVDAVFPQISAGGNMSVLEAVVTDIERYSPARTFSIAAGTTVLAYDPAQPNTVVAKQLFTAGSEAHCDARVAISWPGMATQPVPHGSGFIHVVDGTFAGKYILPTGITILPGPPVVDDTPFTQAQLDAAKSAGVSAGTDAEKARMRQLLGL